MDPQQPSSLPSSSPNFSSVAGPPSSGGKSTLLWVLIGVLGLGAVSFAILSVVAFGQAKVATTTLNQQKQAAAEAAREDQKKLDAQATITAAENPFRSYIAPIEYGSFEIKFPRSWSASVEQARSNQTQVTLIVHPDFIKRDNNANELAAAKILLVQRTLNEYVKVFQSQKEVKRSDTTVSGVKGVQLTGKFADKRTVRMVVIPIRDKSLVFFNEDSNFAPQFDQILAQSKVLP